MPDDLVERLRSVEFADVPQKYLMVEASHEIGRLRAENKRADVEIDRLRDALRLIAEADYSGNPWDCIVIARQALEGK